MDGTHPKVSISLTYRQQTGSPPALPGNTAVTPRKISRATFLPPCWAGTTQTYSKARQSQPGHGTESGCDSRTDSTSNTIWQANPVWTAGEGSCLVRGRRSLDSSRQREEQRGIHQLQKGVCMCLCLWAKYQEVLRDARDTSDCCGSRSAKWRA